MKVSVVLPVLLTEKFLISMTEFCIKAMRQQTALDYELVVVETGSRALEAHVGVEGDLRIDRYLHRPERTSAVRDFNAACDLAAGELLVHTGNDIIVGPGWLEALVEPFERFVDCGASSLAAGEPGAPNVGPPVPVPLIVEGMYTPIMAFRREWRFDEAYRGGYSDSDLIMRMYARGLRAYRNCRSRVLHLNHMTDRAYANDARHAEIEEGERLFYQRWGDSPWLMFYVTKCGGVTYGREHEVALHRIAPYRERVKLG